MADQEPKIPAIDDFGNPAALPGRVLERNAGCYNCRHYDSSSLAFQVHVNACYARDLKVVEDQLVAGGTRTEIAKRTARFKADRTRHVLTGRPGLFGICGIKASESDFVASRHLCTKWDAAQGASLARAPGETLSPLVEEEYDRRGEPVPLSAGREVEPEPEIEVIEEGIPPEARGGETE